MSKLITPNQILSAVQQHDTFVTAVVVKGFITGTTKPSEVKMQHWIWKSDLNFTMLEVIQPIEGFDNAPFVGVLGFKTVWGNN